MIGKSFFNTLSNDGIVSILTKSIRERQDLDPIALHALEQSLRDYVARNMRSLLAVINNPAITELNPLLTKDLIIRAYEFSPSEKTRYWLEQRARKLGFEDCFSGAASIRAPLTHSQARAMEQLRALAALQFRGAVRSGVQLRTTPLIIGPSGVGKSHLVDRLAAALRVEVMRVTVGDWMITGSRALVSTMGQIHTRVRSGARFVLQIDELDKFQIQEGSWSQAQMTEIFNALDRRGAGAEWTDEDRRSFSRNAFVVGSGTWQEVWQTRCTKTIGFGSGGGRFDLEGMVRKSKSIPPELLNRFNSEWLVIEPLSVADFERIVRNLQIGPEVLDPVAAASGGLNFRAVENALTAAALLQVRGEMQEASL